MKVGYSYWGFLSDKKLNSRFEEMSTPDGNAFYSWSIIRQLQKSGYEVCSIMPDRDVHSVNKLGTTAFWCWATPDRYKAYSNMTRLHYCYDLSLANKSDIFDTWDSYKLYECKYIIHEWRMAIEGRNTIDCRKSSDWQPDLFLQECLLEYCKDNNIKLFIFDLDYKLSLEDAKRSGATILELGTKWQNSNLCSKKVYIPFDFSHINDLKYVKLQDRKNKLIYIGNRYERDWCIDKYIPEYLDGVVIHGNWTESGRDSESRWPKIKFKKRLQTREMHDAYSSAVCTILLAKKEYCDHHFMTARLIESVFYCAVPLFIEEYGDDTIEEYAGKYAKLLTVKSKNDVENVIAKLMRDADEYDRIISYLRDRLKMMDCSEFVKTIEELV